MHTACGFLEKDPTDAFELIEKLTNYEAMYETPFNVPNVGGRGLYEVSAEVDSEVRAQVHADETNRLKKQVSSLKACQLCQNTSHTAANCPNLKQVMAAEGMRVEEASYVANGYRGSNTYPHSRAPAPQSYVPYRPPGYQEPAPSDHYLKTVL